MSGVKRTAFFVSDRTGITAETLGHSLLTQFESMNVDQRSIRFIDSEERAREARRRIDRAASVDGGRPLVFSTLINPAVREVVRGADCLFLDFFDTFIGPMEQELGTKTSLAAGRSHGLTDIVTYSYRIEAINFTLSHDDGSTVSQLDEADIILVGISRTGKTPTCLYLSLHYGLRAANFPLTEDDLEAFRLPASVAGHRGKLFGLSVDASRLQQIRQERLPNSRYASPEQCDFESRQAEALFRKHRIPFLHSTMMSIEEIATAIIEQTGLEPPGPPPQVPLHI